MRVAVTAYVYDMRCMVWYVQVGTCVCGIMDIDSSTYSSGVLLVWLP